MTLYLSNRDGDGKTSEEGHYKFQTSVFDGSVLGSTALQVTQNSPTGMSVLVAPGQYRIDTGSEYAYTGWNSSSTPVSISVADPANPRITSIILYVDKGETTSPSPPNNPGIAKFAAVNGTPAAIPIVPDNTTIESQIGAGNPYIVLADVTVPAAAVSIVNANIADARELVVIGNGLVSSDSILDSSITADKLSDSIVTTAKIVDGAITTNKLADASVGDDKWRNNICFFATRTAARSISAATFTLIAAESIAWNYGSGYSNASNSGRFTAPVSGIYSFTANLYAENAAQSRTIVEIRKNGTGMRQWDITGSDSNRANATQIYQLNVGDYVEAWVWMGNAGNIAASSTWFEGHLVTRA